MPDTLDENGLTVMSLPELTSSITTSLQLIYGADINLDSNSPDGQMVNIYSQVAIDQREVLLDIYNMFSVENAYGINLDNLVALNGITRTGATFTTTPVLITVNQAVNLVGQDDVTGAIIFTLADTAGFQWQLVTSYAFAIAGAASLTFACTTPGAVTPAINTITQMATAIAGVTAVNNPSISTLVVGVEEQSDLELKIARAKSFKLASTGPAAAITAALIAAGATDAITYENNTAGTVGVIPAHSIYVVVNGLTDSGINGKICTAIGKKKMPGCGMYGAASGLFSYAPYMYSTMYWNYAVAQALFVKATLLMKKTGETPDTTAVKAAIAAVIYNLGQTASIGDIITAIIGYNPDIIPTAVGVCATIGGAYTDTLAPTLQLNYFTIAVANITLT